MRTLLFIGSLYALLLYCWGASASVDTDQEYPQWARLMEEVREAWSVGDTERGNEKLLLAVELAKEFASAIALAQSLDLVGQELISINPDEAMTSSFIDRAKGS